MDLRRTWPGAPWPQRQGTRVSPHPVRRDLRRPPFPAQLRIGLSGISSVVCAMILMIGTLGCRKTRDVGVPPPETVTLYCSVDESFARTVLDRFHEQTGVETKIVFDSEAGKTSGLVKRIVAESRGSGSRADVFWSSELFNTIVLARAELLEPYDPPTAADIPKRYHDEQHRWTALAARGRVIAFDPTQMHEDALPTRWEQLSEKSLAGVTAIANPLFGTTRGHVAAMFALWGAERGRAFLTKLHEGGVLISDGNSSAVRAIIAHRAKIAATDTDDVWLAQRAGASLDLRYLDMGDGGTLMIPCSVAILKGCRNAVTARRLVDYLVSAPVERLLAESDSRNVPVRPALREALDMRWPAETKLTFDAIADTIPQSERAVREILIR